MKDLAKRIERELRDWLFRNAERDDDSYLLDLDDIPRLARDLADALAVEAP